MGHTMHTRFAHDKIIYQFAPSLRLNKLVECNIPVEICTDTLTATVKRWTFKKYVFQEFLGPGITIKLACIIYRHILGGRNLAHVRSVVVAAIFDFMTVEDRGE